MGSKHVKKYSDFHGGTSYTPVKIGYHNLQMEDCKNPYTGLVGRGIKGDGMIFKFETPRELSFHTMGCIIPMDIVFVLKNKIVKIEHNCQINTSGGLVCKLSDTVLELPAETCKNLNIQVGDSVNF